MYIIINALHNVRRNMSRNVFMLIILVLVIVGSVVALSIKSATSTISHEYRERLGAEVSIVENNEKLESLDRSAVPITMEQYIKLSESEFVRSFNLSTSLLVNGDKIKGKDADEENEGGFANQPSIKLIGATGTKGEIFPDFKNGRRSLAQGREIEKDNEGLVSEDFAQVNNLKLGDVITLKDNTKDSDLTINITIVGIYSDLTTEYPDSGIEVPYMNRRNEVLTTFNTIMIFNNTGEASIYTNYTLRSPEDLDGFTALAREIGISDDYTISADEDAYQQAIAPLESLNAIMDYFIGAMLIVTAGILLLLSFLSIRERQYEIGVLRAMGMKKGEVALGFMTESITILLVSIVIGVGIGGIISTPIANNLLQQQLDTLAAAEEAASNNNIMNMDGNKKEIDKIESIKADLNFIVIIQISGIGLALVLVSNLMAITYITRFEPIDIMRKRD